MLLLGQLSTLVFHLLQLYMQICCQSLLKIVNTEVEPEAILASRTRQISMFSVGKIVKNREYESGTRSYSLIAHKANLNVFSLIYPKKMDKFDALPPLLSL